MIQKQMYFIRGYYILLLLVLYLSFYEKSDVMVYPMKDSEIWDYIRTGEPMDKAGAYGIQGYFAKYIREIKGEYTTIVGLPLGRLWQELCKNF